MPFFCASGITALGPGNVKVQCPHPQMHRRAQITVLKKRTGLLAHPEREDAGGGDEAADDAVDCREERVAGLPASCS